MGLVYGFDSDSWAKQLIGRTVSARYRLDSVLGVGGMGAVFAGVHQEFGRRVAVKVLIPQYGGGSGEVERFRREAQAAASVGKRGVVDILDFGIDAECGPFMVMEFLEGESLEQRLERGGGRMSPNEAIFVVAEVLKTLAAVHAQNIVHRDLKPANIFLSTGMNETEVKILDFGISRFTGAAMQGELTAPGMILGTPRFMASEQAISPQGVDHRADLYAMGLILYTAISGRMPYAEHNGYDIVRAVVLGPSTPISTLCTGLPRPLAAVIDRATLTNRDHRFQSAEEFRQALLAATHGVEIQSGMTHIPAAPVMHPATLQPAVSPTAATGPLVAAGAHPAHWNSAPAMQPGAFAAATPQAGHYAPGYGPPVHSPPTASRLPLILGSMMGVVMIGLIGIVLYLVVRGDNGETASADEPIPPVDSPSDGNPEADVDALPAELLPFQQAVQRGREHLQARRLDEADHAFNEVIDAWISRQMRDPNGMMLVADAYIGLGDIVVARFEVDYPAELTTQVELQNGYTDVAQRYSESMAKYGEAQNADIRRSSCASLHRGFAGEAAANTMRRICGRPEDDANYGQTMEMLRPAYRNAANSFLEGSLSMYAAAGRQPGECADQAVERHRALTAQMRQRSTTSP